MMENKMSNELVFADPNAPKSFVFHDDEKELIKITPDGFYVRGIKLEQDEHEARKLFDAFTDFLNAVQPETHIEVEHCWECPGNDGEYERCRIFNEDLDAFHTKYDDTGFPIYCKIDKGILITKKEKKKATSDTNKAPKCLRCGSDNTKYISGGGYQAADASKNMPEIETDGEVYCNDCEYTWWD